MKITDCKMVPRTHELRYKFTILKQWEAHKLRVEDGENGKATHSLRVNLTIVKQRATQNTGSMRTIVKQWATLNLRFKQDLKLVAIKPFRG